MAFQNEISDYGLKLNIILNVCQNPTRRMTTIFAAFVEACEAQMKPLGGTSSGVLWVCSRKQAWKYVSIKGK